VGRIHKDLLLWRLVLVLTLIVLLAGALSCTVEPETRPRAWIDVPRDGAQVRVNTPVTVTSHAYAGEGVAEITLSVNGEPYRREPPLEPGASFTEITPQWLPAEPGDYVLQVRAYDTEGEVSNPATIRVRVVSEVALALPDLTVTDITLVEGSRIGCFYENIGGAEIPEGDVWIAIYVDERLVAHSNIGVGTTFPAGVSGSFQTEPLKLPTSMEVRCVVDSDDNVAEADEGNNELVKTLGAPPTIITPTFTPTGTPTPTPTFTPTPTLTPTPTFTPTPIPPAEVSFWVERDSITSGECTVLHWDVEHATAVYLDGGGVAGHDIRQVCPTSTTTYHLHVTAPSGDVDRYVTVTVSPPPDTTPPSISNITESDDPIIEPPCPEPNSVTISARVTDPSGVSRAELYYRVVKGYQQGQWRTRPMSPVGGDVYQVTVGPDELIDSLSPYGGGRMEYRIRAWDTRGNMSQSRTHTVTLEACLI